MPQTNIDSSPPPFIRQIHPMVIGVAVLMATLVMAGARQAQPSWSQYTGSPDVRLTIPTLTGKPELCLTCHEGIEQIDEAHPVDAFGCVRCHGGDRLSLDKDAAHASMYGGGNPSDLRVVDQGCGSTECHSGEAADQRDHIARIQRSLHATYAGAIQEVLLNAGLTSQDGPFYGITAVFDEPINHPDGVASLLAFDAEKFDTPSIQQFASECQTCHLTSEPASELYQFRSTGCASCHVLTSIDGLYSGGDPTIARDEPGHSARHQMTVQIPYTQCNTCHYRGSYSTEDMHFAPRTDLDPTLRPSSSSAQRLLEMYPPGQAFASCEWELDCIDCHTAQETMGDGDIHLTQATARTIECRTCHGTLTERPSFVTVDDPNDPAIRRANLNTNYDLTTGIEVLLAPDGTKMGSIRLQDEHIVQVGKVTGTWYEVPVVADSACQQKPDQQEARYCHECHDARAQQSSNP